MAIETKSKTRIQQAEEIAADLLDFMSWYDPFEFNDYIDCYDAEKESLTSDICKGNTEYIVITLNDIGQETEDAETAELISDLLFDIFQFEANSK